MAIAKGTPVVQVCPPPIRGVVDSFVVDQETGEIQYGVTWQDAEGNEQSRFFRDGEIVPE